MQPVRKHTRSGSSAVSAQRLLFLECLLEGPLRYFAVQGVYSKLASSSADGLTLFGSFPARCRPVRRHDDPASLLGTAATARLHHVAPG